MLINGKQIFTVCFNDKAFFAASTVRDSRARRPWDKNEVCRLLSVWCSHVCFHDNLQGDFAWSLIAPKAKTGGYCSRKESKSTAWRSHSATMTSLFLLAIHYDDGSHCERHELPRHSEGQVAKPEGQVDGLPQVEPGSPGHYFLRLPSNTLASVAFS